MARDSPNDKLEAIKESAYNVAEKQDSAMQNRMDQFVSAHGITESKATLIDSATIAVASLAYYFFGGMLLIADLVLIIVMVLSLYTLSVRAKRRLLR